MRFDISHPQSSIIKVIGVGGGGGNAVSHMYRQGIKGVDFIICNTDAQALELSPIPTKVQLGDMLTKGRGAGANPEKGKNAAIESADVIKDHLKDAEMVFVTAGMGKGTGTGAGPMVAKLAKEMDILTIGVVTLPFSWEGPVRSRQAEEGLAEMQKYVDALLIISNEKLKDMYGNLSYIDAFAQSDNVLTIAAKGIADIITTTGNVNVDFNDVKTVLTNSGVALMGIGIAEGENRAKDAIMRALNSPLLNDNDITGAKDILINVSSGSNVITGDEIDKIFNYAQSEAGNNANLLFGLCQDDSLGDSISVTIIAAGFNAEKEKPNASMHNSIERNVIHLNDITPKEEAQNLPNTNSTVSIKDVDPQLTLEALVQTVTEEQQRHQVAASASAKPKEALTPQQIRLQERNQHLNRNNNTTAPKRETKSEIDVKYEVPAILRAGIQLDDVNLNNNQQRHSRTTTRTNENGEVEFIPNKFFNDIPD